jgi:hypothetical protein
MLLSILISFILARRFKGKIYVLLMTVVLILVSLLSIGFPSVWGTLRDGTTIWQVNLPTTPLAFPFHTSISREYLAILLEGWIPPFPLPPIYRVRLYFLAIQVWTNEITWNYLLLTSERIILLVSFFLLVNLAGAILGYWISKTTFIGRYLARRKTAEKDLVDDIV